jgi:hypothetical protein
MQAHQVNSYSQFSAAPQIGDMDAYFHAEGQWHLLDDNMEVRVAFSIQIHPKMVSIWQMYSPIETRNKVALFVQQDPFSFNNFH